MPGYQLQSPCRVEDGLQIAQSQVSAFFEEAWWRLSWTDRTRESLIQSIADRSPKNLLTKREVRRHQKIVHLETGDIVGYARWILPESHKDAWLEAQTPDVSDEQKEAFAKRHAETDWNPREDNDKLDDHIDGWREKHKQEMDMGKNHQENVAQTWLRLTPNRITLPLRPFRSSAKRTSKFTCQLRSRRSQEVGHRCHNRGHGPTSSWSLFEARL